MAHQKHVARERPRYLFRENRGRRHARGIKMRNGILNRASDTYDRCPKSVNGRRSRKS